MYLGLLTTAVYSLETLLNTATIAVLTSVQKWTISCQKWKNTNAETETDWNHQKLPFSMLKI